MNYKINHQVLQAIGIQTWHLSSNTFDSSQALITFDNYIIGAKLVAILPLPLNLANETKMEITTTAKKMLSVLELGQKEIVLATILLSNFKLDTILNGELSKNPINLSVPSNPSDRINVTNTHSLNEHLQFSKTKPHTTNNLIPANIVADIFTKISLLYAKNIFHFGTTLAANIPGNFISYHPKFLMDNPQFKRQAFNDLKLIKLN